MKHSHLILLVTLSATLHLSFSVSVTSLKFLSAIRAQNPALRQVKGGSLSNAAARQSSDTFESWDEVLDFLSTYTNKPKNSACPVPNTEAMDECCFRSACGPHICAPTDGYLYDSCDDYAFQLSADCRFKKIDCCVKDTCGQEKCFEYNYPNFQEKAWNKTFEVDIFCEGVKNLTQEECFDPDEIDREKAVQRGLVKVLTKELNKQFANSEEGRYVVSIQFAKPTEVDRSAGVRMLEVEDGLSETKLSVRKRGGHWVPLYVWVRVLLLPTVGVKRAHIEALADRKVKRVMNNNNIPDDWEAYFISYAKRHNVPRSLKWWFETKYRVEKR